MFRRRFLVALAAVTFALGCPSAQADVSLYVDAVNGSDVAGDGSALAPWKSLTHTLSEILGLSDLVYDVWIAPGVYDEANGETFPIGFGTITSFSRTLRLHGSTTAPSVLNAPDMRDGVRIEAFERDCLGCLVEDLVVTSGQRGNVGIQVDAWSITIQRCHVQGFWTGILVGAGGMGGPGSAPWFQANLDRNVLVDNNIAIQFFGGAADFPGVQAEVIGDITNNVLSGNGVAVSVLAQCWCLNGAQVSVVPRIWNNTIVGSTSDGIQVHSEHTQLVSAFANPEIGNNVIAGSGGTGIAMDPGSETDPSSIAANLFWQNTGGDVTRWVNSVSNLFADPLFVNPIGGNYHVQAASPAIDRGLDAAAVPDWDNEGATRPQDGDGDLLPVVDIGAFEFPGPVVLRRADFTSLAPITPDLASAFPFDAGNPRTPVVVPALLADAIDAGALADTARPLMLYQTDPDSAGRVLLVAKAAGTALELGIHLR